MKNEIVPSICAAFSGHRPKSLPWYENVSHPICEKFRVYLYEAIDLAYSCGYRQFLYGAAIGADHIFAEMALTMRGNTMFRDLQVIAVLPCVGQEKYWSELQRRKYTELLARSDDVLTLKDAYTRSCMMERNRFMVKHSRHLIAAWNGQKTGGTYRTLQMATAAGHSIDCIRLDQTVGIPVVTANCSSTDLVS